MTSPTARPTARLESTPPLSSAPAHLPPATLPPPLEAGDQPRDRAGRLRTRLSERDLAVLDSLAKLRLLSGQHIQRLHVADGSPGTRARRTRAIMKRLTDLRVVTRIERRIGGIQAGSDGHLYRLSGLGQAVLGIGGPLGGRRRSSWATKPAFQDHVLAVAELCVQLTERTRTGDCELLAFDAEPACWRRFSGPGGGRITLKPDAYLQLGVGELELTAFIELDLGTESLPTISRKCQRYLAYWQSGHEQRDRSVFPRVWWLASTTVRAAGIERVIWRLGGNAAAIFAVALSHQAPQLLTELPPGTEARS